MRGRGKGEKGMMNCERVFCGTILLMEYRAGVIWGVYTPGEVRGAVYVLDGGKGLSVFPESTNTR